MERAHTGRRRNEAARQAILDAVLELVADPDHPPVNIETIAARAGVGKQTIYRWWPSKQAVLLEAMTEEARISVPTPDTGSVAADLRDFLTATFRAARRPRTTDMLRTAMAGALQDERAGEILRDFTATRRAELRSILERGRGRGELPADTDLGLLVDQAYGVLWYRVLLEAGPLTPTAAAALADGLLRQASHAGPAPG